MHKIRIPLATLLAYCLLMALAIPAQMQVSPSDDIEQQSDSDTKVNRSATSDKGKSSKYIVRMSEDPVVAYKGNIRGLRATKPRKGQKIDPNSPDVVNYVKYLDERHNAVLSKAGGRKIYDYRYSLNGFTAELTAEQVALLAAADGVVSIERDEANSIDTSTTASFLGLDAPGLGLWNQLGGVDSAGENMIIGIVDTGVWPEHPSFSDRTGAGPNGQEGKLGYHQIPGWHGKCVPGEAFAGSDCNQKLIGAQYFYEGSGLERVIPEDYISARDYNSHGSHTASTAGGNSVPADGLFTRFGNITGMAPRARIAAYKVCWDDGDPNTGDCFTSDSVAAIDQAVADGVDVINFSISGSTTSFLSAVEVAFLFAADAGVFVATSAGNSGPTASTVAHPSPWVTTVAAGTHSRSGAGSVALGNGTTINGVSLTVGSNTAPFVYAETVKKAAAAVADARLCFPNTLDPALVAGKIVLCDRGTNARVEKSQVVGAAGGVGMVLANVVAGTLNADPHSVPTLHAAHTDRAALLAYALTPGATAKIAAGVPNMAEPAPLNASFSSRGPSAATGDQLKPDVTAPGQDILAAVSPVTNGGRLFELFNGTSMSSPHVAGLGALLKSAHPDWSPMMVKSALMTTAYDLLSTAAAPIPVLPNGGRAFIQGAGHVRPNNAVDPGLIYDSNFNDWFGFLCGTGQQVTGCTPGNTIDPSNLNLASIAIGDLVKPQTVTRTVRNVSNSASTYNATVTSFAGISVTVNPTSFTIQPGETKSYTVTFSWLNAPTNNNVYQSGFLTWSDGTHSVRSPLVVRPIALLAPATVSGTGTTNNTTYNISTGYTGPLTYAVRGLVAADTKENEVVQDDPTNNFNTATPDTNQGFKKYTYVVPAGTTLVRFALFDDFTDGADDLDLFVYNTTNPASPVLVGSSNSGTSAETVTQSFTNPTAAAITYTVYVHGWETDGPDATFTLFSWVLGTANAGNMTVTGPAAVTPGSTYPITLNWSGLTANKKYLGVVRYSTGATLLGTTIVRVDTPTP